MSHSRRPAGSPGEGNRKALFIAIVYAVLATVWIFASDWLIVAAVADPRTRVILAAAKGGLFVAITGFVLYRLLRALLRRKEDVESRLSLLARRSPDLIFRYRLGPDRRYEYVSPAAETLTGYTVEEHYRNPDLAMETVHPDDRAALSELMEHPEEMDDTVALRWIRRDGRTVWMELKSTVVRDADGTVVVEGILRDVTAGREAERRHRILEAAVEASDESVLITDARGAIEYVNPAFSRITGWKRAEVLGRNPRILKSGFQDAALYERMWKTLLAGRTFQARFTNRRADGTLYTQEATVTPVPGPSGRIEHYVGVARDVTDRQILERQLREAQRAEAVGQIIAGVSHDFRNMLGIVQTQVDLANSARTEGDFPAEALAEIGRAAARGTELVRKLLTLGRSEELERVPIALVQVVGELRSALRAVLPTPISLELDLPDDPLAVRADRGSIEQILVNLATNARDAIPRGGSVVVEADRTDEIDVGSGDLVVGVRQHPVEGWVRLRFRDDGEGMDAGTLRRIFEPFFTTKPPERGTGLGLPMVARLVRLHGGAITVSSRPAAGTTVTLYLPATTQVVSSATGEPPDPGDLPRGRGQRVLVVEDEAPLLNAQIRILERLGYSPTPAISGDEAVRVLEEQGTEIDLVMTDLIMPGRGGKEVYEEMGVMGLRRIPVIFVSGYTATDVSDTLPPDADSFFLEKPWTLSQLAHKVSAALAVGDASRDPARN